MINMRKLQNNFTTSEQSEQLLKLGVPADSADMYYKRTMLDPYIFTLGVRFSVYAEVEDIVPCWSVGRLIEILRICVTDEEEIVEIMENLIYWTLLDLTDFLLQTYQEYKEVIDFSKLED